MAFVSSVNGAISVKTDISDCMKFFDGLDVNRRKIQERLMRTTGQGAVKAAKQGFSRTLKSRTGNLKRHIRYVMGFKADYVKVYSDAQSNKATSGARATSRGISFESSRLARYGFMLAKGYTITDQNAEVLTFQIGGQWKRKHRIKVEAKDWIEPSVVRYADSNELHNRLDKEFQKQIDYWEKRITGGNLNDK